MQLTNNEIHVWTANLSISEEQEKQKIRLLSQDEIERARHFHFSEHKSRFIAARSILREILSLYLRLPANEIEFTYSKTAKPFLHQKHASLIQFNLSHSHQMAVYAISLKHAIGIDIEKIQDSYPQQIPARFFTAQENETIQNLNAKDKRIAFFRIWAKKEALIKATGKGLFTSLANFSVSIDDIKETIKLDDKEWTVMNLPIHPQYQTAIATSQTISNILYWRFAAS